MNQAINEAAQAINEAARLALEYIECRKSLPKTNAKCVGILADLKKINPATAAKVEAEADKQQIANQSLDPNRCNAIAGAHLQIACQEARKYGRGFTGPDLANWIKEVQYDYHTNTYNLEKARSISAPTPSVPASGSVPGGPTAPGGSNGPGSASNTEVPDYMQPAAQIIPFDTSMIQGSGPLVWVAEHKVVVGLTLLGLGAGIWWLRR